MEVVRGVVRRVVRGVVRRVVRGAESVGSPRIGGQSFLLSRQQILTKISLVIFNVVVKNKSNVA